VAPVQRCAFWIPFRDLEPVVDHWRERTCVSKPSHGVPPHVTLLLPAPPDLDGAVAALQDFSPFEVIFRSVGRFPDTLWLAPEPVELFVAMSEALARRFPDHPPYEGRFETITPHLTVAQGDDLEDAEAALVSALPIYSRSSAVALCEQVTPDRWREVSGIAL
jgi:2'-5' RNA ligase